MAIVKQYNQELYHYGVKGMKWGVRKGYQYKDGTATNKGIKRYNKMLAREDAALDGRHGSAVVAKYMGIKSDAQKKADKQYIETQRNLAKARLDKNLTDDFDFLEEIDRPGSQMSKLFEQACNASDVRASAYAGEKWVDKYIKELGRAIDKDNRERGRY